MYNVQMYIHVHIIPFPVLKGFHIKTTTDRPCCITQNKPRIISTTRKIGIVSGCIILCLLKINNLLFILRHSQNVHCFHSNVPKHSFHAFDAFNVTHYICMLFQQYDQWLRYFLLLYHFFCRSRLFSTTILIFYALALSLFPHNFWFCSYISAGYLLYRTEHSVSWI